MMLWAVFRAIFLPAALVTEGCLRFEFVDALVDAAAAAPLPVADSLVEVTGGTADAAFDAPGGK
jgi:hypothetical protein